MEIHHAGDNPVGQGSTSFLQGRMLQRAMRMDEDAEVHKSIHGSRGHVTFLLFRAQKSCRSFRSLSSLSFQSRDSAGYASLFFLADFTVLAEISIPVLVGDIANQPGEVALRREPHKALQISNSPFAARLHSC